jgi:uncharacterized protein (TIRG00374 family)
MLESLMASAGRYFSVVSTASLKCLLLAFLTYYVSVVLYGIRWKLVLKGVGREAPLWELVKAILASIFMNNVTPMSRSGGELLRMAWVSRRANIPTGVSAVSIIYERILETIPILALFLLGMSYFSSGVAAPPAPRDRYRGAHLGQVGLLRQTLASPLPHPRDGG